MGARGEVGPRPFQPLVRSALSPRGLKAVRGVPTSTYRLQLHGHFGFRDAARVADYLAKLGVGAVYVSPVLRAQRGSVHGYDVVDHAVLNPELGTVDEFRIWNDAVTASGMGFLMDFVPNHVGVGTGENAWWNDVLESGPSSPFADFFDIEWESPEPVLRGKVLLPVLARPFGEEVDDGKIAIERDGGRLWVTYADRRFPASPRSYVIVLQRAAGHLALGDESPARRDLESIVTAIRHLPDPSTANAFERRERAREKEVIKRRLRDVCTSSQEVATAVAEAIQAVSSSPERLERFLAEQNYRLSFWRVATDEINYRRFFDVNELAAIRMEAPAVFSATHGLMFELIAEGRVTGLRLDHTDGLYDPNAYFRALQQGIHGALARGSEDDDLPSYVVAEKILASGERLPHSWAISGTNGYDFLAAINALWVDPQAVAAFDDLYHHFAEGHRDYQGVAYQSKIDVMSETFSAEIHALGHALKRIAESSRHARDFTLSSLLRAIQETIAALDVYRTYVRDDGTHEASDESRVVAATERARRRNPTIDPAIFQFVREVLLLKHPGEAAVRFAMRFQQLTGPIMAKGVEDTALYRYNRLIGLNEVGCDPSRFGSTIAVFHAHNAAALARFPLSMTTTTTHDTKRSEDVRARLAVLSEVPERWRVLVSRLEDIARSSVVSVDGLPAPSPADAYLFHQTVVGVWPYEGVCSDTERAAFKERVSAYLAKAVHEAKVRSSWKHPNAAYDQAVRRFVERALDSPRYCDAVDDFVRSIATYGATNSLAQVALRLASPGVPDVYQGCELWNFSLVNPDNRRSVDYARRRAALDTLASRGAPTVEVARELVRSFTDGRIKMLVTHTGLTLRRRDPALFLEGAYDSIDAGAHAVAFERSLAGRRLICVVPRLALKLARRVGSDARWPLGAVWQEQRLTLTRSGHFTHVWTGERFDGQSWPMGRVLGDFPVAWLYAAE